MWAFQRMSGGFWRKLGGSHLTVFLMDLSNPTFIWIVRNQHGDYIVHIQTDTHGVCFPHYSTWKMHNNHN